MHRTTGWTKSKIMFYLDKNRIQFHGAQSIYIAVLSFSSPLNTHHTNFFNVLTPDPISSHLNLTVSTWDKDRIWSQIDIPITVNYNYNLICPVPLSYRTVSCDSKSVCPVPLSYRTISSDSKSVCPVPLSYRTVSSDSKSMCPVPLSYRTVSW